MRAEDVVTPDMIRKFLEYEEKTGEFFWKERAEKWFATAQAAAQWNAKYSGKPALRRKSGNGYRSGTIMGRSFLAHRVAMAFVFGEWPKNEVDHIDGNPENNRILNLRNATRSQNLANARKRKNAKSSRFKGVSAAPDCARWVARCGRDYLGMFTTEMEAAAAYEAAAKAKFAEFARVEVSA